MSAGRIPSLNWLRVFEAAARYQSFARAAETLNMSPPAVSQQIRALEDHLGRSLFERGPQWVRLTDAGRAFLPTVAEALDKVDLSARTLFGNPGGETLTVQVSHMMGCGWLAPRVPAFQAAHPGVQLCLLSGIRDEDFRRAGADLTISFGMPPAPGEEGHQLFGETLYPVALPAIAERIAKPADLTGQPLIEIATHRANWQQVFDAAGLSERRGLRMHYADTTQIAFALAAHGGGVALARAPATDVLERAHGLVPCLPGFALPGLQRYHLIYQATSRLGPAARAFRDWLLEEAQTGGISPGER